MPTEEELREIFWSWGDVNRDGEIDAIDRLLIYRAMFTDESMPHGTGHNQYNPNADLNKDGEINYKEHAIWGRNFGLTFEQFLKIYPQTLWREVPRYHHRIKWEAETTKEYASNEYKVLTGLEKPSWGVNLGELKEKIAEAIPEAVNKELQNRAMKEGYYFTDVAVTIIKIDFSFRTTSRQFRDYTMKRQYLKAHILAHIHFDSVKPIAESPIAPAILLILKWVITAIVIGVVAYFAIEALRRWLTSMTTTKYERHTIKYDEEGNIIEETWEEGEEPSLLGIAGVGSILIILVVIVLFFFLGSRK